MRIIIIGAGRAGQSFATALTDVGHDVRLVHHGENDARGADVVLLCVPDDRLGDVAGELIVEPTAVVAHAAGSRALDVLAPHPFRASLHPLVPLPDPVVGARRLVGATYCVAGDERAAQLVADLGGRAITVADADRVAYHATACVTANHLVALLGQAERLAQSAGLELADFLELAKYALEDVERFGPTAALTGPASRGDLETIDAHLGAISDAERPLYVALAAAALSLAESRTADLTAS